MRTGVDSWQLFFLVAAVLIVVFQAWRGWQRGLVRQLFSFFAIAAAYAVAILGGPLLVPALRPIGFPDQVLMIAGGVLLGAVVFALLSLLSALLFKSTKHQSVGLVRFGYGSTGAVLGALFGVLLVWACAVGIRLLGSVAQTEMEVKSQPAPRRITRMRDEPPPVPREPNPVVRGLAEMKQSLETGPAGAVVDRVDPVPASVYHTLTQLGQMVSSQERVARFLADPGVAKVAQHPKIVALQNDPVVAREVLGRNFVALLRNPRIVEAANDPEVATLLRQLEFQKALDHAVRDAEEPRDLPSRLEE